MSFTELSPDDRKRMLESINVFSRDELFEDIPPNLHFKNIGSIHKSICIY